MATSAPDSATHGPPTWLSFVAGGVGGMTAAIITSPLDVLRTRLQSDSLKTVVASAGANPQNPAVRVLHVPRYLVAQVRETGHILQSISQNEGWRALFRGLGPNLAGIVPASAVKFYTYNTTKSWLQSYAGNRPSLNGREAMWTHVVSAASASIATSTATNPIWLIKTRLQLRSTNGIQMSALQCVKQVWQKEGIRGFYGGMAASYLGAAESAVHWVLYEQAKQFLRERQARYVERSPGGKESSWRPTMAWLEQAAAAGGTKLVVAVAAYPHEVVRTRLRQAPQSDGSLKYTGIIQCFRRVWAEEGARALYGGLTPHLLRAVPSTAIIFGVFEGLMSFFRR